MHKAFEYRLYPNRCQRRMLLSCLAESRRLYNEMLESVKAHYEEPGKFLSRYDLTCRFKGRGGSLGSEHVPQTTVQTLADRLDKALKRFFHRRELGQKVGFPRFKSPNRWHSIQLRQYGSDLRVRNMVKNHYLARAISDAGWSQFVNILCLKAESAGCRVYKVPPHFTSQLCSNCGEVVEKSLSVRTHTCPSCGYVADRDHNAARNILARAEPSYRNAGDGPHGARSRLL